VFHQLTWTGTNASGTSALSNSSTFRDGAAQCNVAAICKKSGMILNA
jgi:hypothetical protein